MDRIERIGPREPAWLQPAIDPDREDLAERRRRDEERRRRARREPPRPERPEGDDPPHHVDVRV
jgi:hypothetical protein